MIRIPASLRKKFARIELLLCDVDGVLTDGTVWMGSGAETKRFHIRDGLGLRVLQKQGVKVGWISRRPSPATSARAEDLKIDFLHQGDHDKVGAIDEILSRTGMNWSQVCFVGDDIVDLGALKRAGVSVAVADASPEVRRKVDYVTRMSGGRGAVREVVEIILHSQGKWSQVVKEYSS